MRSLEHRRFDPQSPSDIVLMGLGPHSLSNAQKEALEDLLSLYDSMQGMGVPNTCQATITEDNLERIFKSYAHTYEGKKLEFVRRAILDDAVNCIFCGINDPDTLDHFLPKQRFRVFATYTKNLLPSCDTCNRRKDEAEDFLHPYFMDLNTQRYILISIEIATTGVDLNFSFVAGLSFQTALQNQFSLLRLEKRWRKRMISRITDIAHTLSRLDMTPQKIQQYLESEEEKFRRLHGANHWEACLMDGLRQSNTFAFGGYQILLT